MYQPACAFGATYRHFKNFLRKMEPISLLTRNVNGQQGASAKKHERGRSKSRMGEVEEKEGLAECFLDKFDTEGTWTAETECWPQIPDYKPHLIISRTQYIFKGKIISSIYKPHLTISRMCLHYNIRYLQCPWWPFKKSINKPHRCISRREESVRKKSRLIVRNLRVITVKECSIFD